MAESTIIDDGDDSSIRFTDDAAVEEDARWLAGRIARKQVAAKRKEEIQLRC